MELKRILPLLALCAAPLFAQSAGVTEVSVSFSATPTFTCNAGVTNFSITLTGNVTSSTFSCAAIANGSFKVCQDATGSRTFTWPSGAKGFGTIDSTASKCSRQPFKWDGSVLQATGAMVTDGTAPGGIPGLGTLAGLSQVTSSQVNNTVAVTGADLNTSSQVVKVNGASVPASAKIIGTNSSSQATAAAANDVSSITGCADAGGTDSYACSLSPVISSYATGAHYMFKANTANTGAASINFNSLGAKTIKKAAGGITTDLADNDIRAGQWVDVIYDGTNMQMQSLLGNVPSGTSGAVGVTVSSSSPVTVSTIGYYFNDSTGAITYNLPTITGGVVGSQFCFQQAATRTGVITLQAPASTFIVVSGAAGSSAGSLVSPGALGDAACVLAVDTTHYYGYPQTTAWTNN